MDSGKREVFSLWGKSIVSDSCTGPRTCDFLVRIPLMTPTGHRYLFFASLVLRSDGMWFELPFDFKSTIALFTYTYGRILRIGEKNSDISEVRTSYRFNPNI